MTTTVTLKVNGRYVAKVKQDDKPWVDCHGNYDGSPNSSGETVFNLVHATSNKFVINEEQVPEPVKEEPVEAAGAAEPMESGNLKADFKD
jgi:hypothetical protein